MRREREGSSGGLMEQGCGAGWSEVPTTHGAEFFRTGEREVRSAAENEGGSRDQGLGE